MLYNIYKSRYTPDTCFRHVCSVMNARVSRTYIEFSLQPGHYSSLNAPNLQPTAKQERYDQFGKQHHSRELLMIGIVMLVTRGPYKKYNKISSGI